MKLSLATSLFATAPAGIKVAIASLFLIAAAILFCLALEAGLYPSAQRYLQQYMRAEYWIRRQKRKHIAYTFAMGRAGDGANDRALHQPREVGGVITEHLSDHRLAA